MNDFALHDNPKLSSIVKCLRWQGYNITIEKRGSKGPGFYSIQDNKIILNNWYLRGQDPEYPEDRLIIVLFHELGHADYHAKLRVEGKKENRADSEYAAFKNSLERAIELVETVGDYGPLKLVVFHLERRQQSGSKKEYYQYALNKIIRSKLWKSARLMLAGNFAGLGLPG